MPDQGEIYITQLEAMVAHLTPLDCDIVREAVSWIHNNGTQAQKDRVCVLAAELECTAPECGT